MSELSNTVNRKFVKSLNISDYEIETDTGWVDLTHIHQTIDYEKWIITTVGGLTLEAADTHIVFDSEYNQIFIKDLIVGVTQILTDTGPQLVTSVINTGIMEPMFDLTVDSDNHRFYSNKILSHNTTIINALSYAMFGNAISNIRKDNLVNRTNAKNMLVTIEFEKDGIDYKIERGRKPAIMRMWAGGKEKEITDDAQGDSRETQAELERIFGMSHDMFKQIVALNTYTEPFLSMRTNDQRLISEQLLGVTLLSEKADKLKEQLKATKESVVHEEYRIKAVNDANKRIEDQIESLRRRERMWLAKHNEDMTKLVNAYDDLSNIDIDAELAAHKALALWDAQMHEYESVNKALKRAVLDNEKESKLLAKLEKEIAALDANKCYACGGIVHTDTHAEVIELKQRSLSETKVLLAESTALVTELTSTLSALTVSTPRPTVFYASEGEAFEHRSSIESILSQLERKEQERDPYSEQIEEMSRLGIEVVDYDIINSLNSTKEHQEFLLKLLSNKDSFIRKRIIDQNLSYLNIRLSYYLDKLGLPHAVKFNNDLTVSIEELGRELDFDNLSRGERNRLILSLNFAFRDVWESLFQSINLLFIDELIDNGLDANGVESALGVLKKISRDQKKSIWLVSHKDELVGRVNNILHVIKTNGFTVYNSDVEPT